MTHPSNPDTGFERVIKGRIPLASVRVEYDRDRFDTTFTARGPEVTARTRISDIQMSLTKALDDMLTFTAANMAEDLQSEAVRAYGLEMWVQKKIDDALEKQMATHKAEMRRRISQLHHGGLFRGHVAAQLTSLLDEEW